MTPVSLSSFFSPLFSPKKATFKLLQSDALQIPPAPELLARLQEWVSWRKGFFPSTISVLQTPTLTSQTSPDHAVGTVRCSSDQLGHSCGLQRRQVRHRGQERAAGWKAETQMNPQTLLRMRDIPM